MLSRRFGFFLNLVMHGYASGKHNINIWKKHLSGVTSDVLQMERKTYKVKWSIGSRKFFKDNFSDQMLHFHSFSHIMHLEFS